MIFSSRERTRGAINKKMINTTAVGRNLQKNSPAPGDERVSCTALQLSVGLINAAGGGRRADGRRKIKIQQQRPIIQSTWTSLA